MEGKIICFYVASLLIGNSLVCGLPQNHTDDQINAEIEAGTFQTPSSNFKPRFRYWIPDASVNLTRVSQDIVDAAAVGAGGVEVLGYYLYDSLPGEFTPTDWTIYGWGTPAWKKLFDTIVSTHKDNGLIMDFAMGPNQGQGVPADPDDDGLLWDLFPYNASVPIGGRYSGEIPGWGTVGTLQAVVTGLVTNSELSNSSAPSLPNTTPSNRTQVTLSAESLTDVTNQTKNDGTIELEFPSNVTGIEFQIFAIYLVREQYRNEAYPPSLVGPETLPQDFIHNGSWTVDHFSAQGAKVMTDFWENYLLINGTKEALMEVGNYGWEDSCEINPVLYWTRFLPERFQERRGYDISKWLPILFHQNGRAEFSMGTWYITDEPDAGNQHIADYRTTLTEMYGDYLNALTQWANDLLNLQFSAQVSYNMAMDMQSNIANVNGPECESLGFSHVIDAYRQYAGPANLAGKRIISTECGANFGETYQQSLPELLWDVKRSIAGSVNNFVFHGYPFSGNYGNTTWPTFTTFNYLFSEMHGRHQPAWDYYSDALGYTARLEYVFQSGTPRRDLAFYQKFTVYPNVVRNYQPIDLEQAGWTYEYLNPDNMYLPSAVVKSQILAPDKQAFKALIIRANDSMTVEGVQKIVEYANEGLPIVISGGIPNYLAGFNASGVAYMKEALSSITTLENVHMVPYQELSSVISSLGITPLTKVSADRIWYTYWRTDDEKARDYVFVYNDAFGVRFGGGSSQGTVEFQSTGVPYLYDAWTGTQTPVLNYTRSNSSITIFFELAGNQSAIVAFHNNETAQGTVVTSTSPDVLSIEQGANSSGLTVHVGPGSGGASCQTSDGRVHQLPSPSAGIMTLDNWTLTVEHWDPPSDIYDIETVASKTNTTHPLSNLTSWGQIAGANLENVSGRGYYTTSFTWTPSANVSGALIDLGVIVHTVRVAINGHVLPPLDVTWAKADIGQYLVQGENEVEVVTTTTLINRIIPIWRELETSGLPAILPAPATQDYGLLFDVKLIPYRAVSLT